MFSFLRRLFGLDKRLYARQRKMLETGDAEQVRSMAGSAETHPEILYFLARDSRPDVRQAVARNAATPVQASALLAYDGDVDVRLALAARLVDLLPHLSTERHRKLYAYAAQALGVLAEDEVMKIRQVLSATLKDHAKAPPKVVGQLARDVERAVSEPILRFCAALSDDDLLDILRNHPEPWVITTIAERPVVSGNVAEAVIDTGDVPAGRALIENPGADLSHDTLQKIISVAVDIPDWHAPLAVRKELSLDLAHQLTGFVSATVLGVLEERSDFDAETRQEIADIVQRRLDFRREGGVDETPEAKVDRYVRDGKLDADVILDALVWRERRFVLLALARLSNIHPVVAEKMLTSATPKSVVALCWRARLPMRTTVEVQRSYARIAPQEIMYARGGSAYPMSLSEIKWQLEFFGVEQPKEN